MLRDEQKLPLDPLAVAKEKEEEYLKLMAEVGPIHEVVVIAREHAGKLPMPWLRRNTPRDQQVLHHVGIHELFSAVVTSEDVVNQKPAPDIFLEAARRIGVERAFAGATKTPTWA